MKCRERDCERKDEAELIKLLSAVYVHACRKDLYVCLYIACLSRSVREREKEREKTYLVNVCQQVVRKIGDEQRRVHCSHEFFPNFPSQDVLKRCARESVERGE
ncbi:hypothetical protein C0Q70_10331 [Pomacea canaliculata]|uniref:Uncharacterized protein n=1 Tax=Pomacea canaliculata TaxID=400727 RepID=A0A2T7PCA9_POMCA|nr:hypothetical protein C0Q70_10331 [Pomacea canaliculata]